MLGIVARLDLDCFGDRRTRSAHGPILVDMRGASRAEADIFHLMSDYFYEPEMAKLTRTQAREIVYAGIALLRKVRRESKDLEAFILAQPDVTKSDEWAPRASGY